MKAYRHSVRLKLGLVVLAVLISVASLAYTSRTVDRLREREQFLEKVQDRAMARPRYGERGKCDFCGEPDLPVRRDFENPLSFGGESRPALLCEACDRPRQDR